MKQRGFSLIELLIYIGIFAASSVFMVSILIIFTQIHVRQTSMNEVNDQISFVNGAVGRLVRNSSLIDMESGMATSTLTLRMASSTLDPTSVYLESGTLYLQEGSGAPLPLTDSSVTVNDFAATKYENPGGFAVVQLFLNMSYDTENARAEYTRTAQTAISRVSAATFDSDLLPNAGGSYSLGNTTQNWLDAHFSGSIGIGAQPVGSARIKSAGDIAFTASDEGIIFVTPGGSCLRLTLTNSGTISTSTVACP